MVHGPWNLGTGALGKKLNAYLMRQFVTESIYINSLADHHIWSTIKTLPAILPEPKLRGPRCQRPYPSTTVLWPRAFDIGATEGIFQSDLDLIKGVGLKLAGLASSIAGLFN